MAPDKKAEEAAAIAALTAELVVRPFPEPVELVAGAYAALRISAGMSEEIRQELAEARRLPKPWLPATCTEPALRADLWKWLEQVVIWLNHEYTWGTKPMIPACWPLHPHIVNELAVLADRRRRAELDPNSDALEVWHRFSLSGFVQRMRERLEGQCDGGQHKDWPGKPREQAFIATQTADIRAQRISLDQVASIELAKRRLTTTLGELRQKRRADLAYVLGDEP